ncbi:MAG: sialidase family protein [Planctomycetota bacterium]
MPPTTPQALIDDEAAARHVAGVERTIAVTGGGYWPTLLALPDGTLAAVTRGGSPHLGLRSRLDLVRSSDGGRRWSAPETIVPSIPGVDVRGASAGVMADGSVVVAYWEDTRYRGERFDPAVGACTPYTIRSDDGGRTWSAKRPLVCPPLPHGAAVYGRMAVLPDGTAMTIVYGPADDRRTTQASCLLRSRDHGRSWSDATVIAHDTTEGTVLAAGDGRLLAFLRTTDPDVSRDGATVLSTSDHGGRTWGEPVALTRPHQHPADACVLASGAVLLTYGNRLGPLAVGAMLSDDGGRTWDRDGRVVLAADTMTLRDKPWGDCGYPSTVQLDDGTILTLYYRLGHAGLPEAERQRCRQYERDMVETPPPSQDMRRFEQAVCLRYTEAQLRGVADGVER